MYGNVKLQVPFSFCHLRYFLCCCLHCTHTHPEIRGFRSNNSDIMISDCHSFAILFDGISQNLVNQRGQMWLEIIHVAFVWFAFFAEQSFLILYLWFGIQPVHKSFLLRPHKTRGWFWWCDYPFVQRAFKSYRIRTLSGQTYVSPKGRRFKLLNCGLNS